MTQVVQIPRLKSVQEIVAEGIMELRTERDRLRGVVSEWDEARIALEAAMEDFHQAAIYDHDGVVLRMSGYEELRAAVYRVVNGEMTTDGGMDDGEGGDGR